MQLKYISIWQRGNGLSCTGGVLAVSWDFVRSGWLPGVKRGHTPLLPQIRRTWPEGHGRHDSDGGQRDPAHTICTTGVLRGARAHSPVEQIFGYLWQPTDEEQGAPSGAFQSLLHQYPLYSDYYSWGIVTPATRRHSWRGQDGFVWQKKNHLTSCNPERIAVKQRAIIPVRLPAPLHRIPPSKNPPCKIRQPDTLCPGSQCPRSQSKKKSYTHFLQ